MSQRPPGPRALRIVVVLALGLGVLVSISATQGAAIALSADRLSLPEPDLGALRAIVPYAREQEAALKAQERARLQAIESMAALRAAVLVLLSGSAMVVVVSALQIRMAREAPSLSAARRLAAAAVAGAVLRTLDGAQDLVIVQRATRAWSKVLVELKVPDTAVSPSLTHLMVSVASVGWTIVVVALFVTVAVVIRSRPVQEAFVPDED